MSETKKKLKILCLHGRRTSGSIFFMQTAALRYHTDIECMFIDAPYLSLEDPDPGIQMFYPNRSYYEWYLRNNETNLHEGVEKSIESLESLLKTNSIDGILGFSQGTAMATILLQLQMKNKSTSFIKFAILIGGIDPPHELHECSPHITIPSLHIIGNNDPYKSRSLKLLELYSQDLTTLLVHEEAHNIPTMQTGLYPQIKSWLQTFTS